MTQVRWADHSPAAPALMAARWVGEARAERMLAVNRQYLCIDLALCTPRLFYLRVDPGEDGVV
ncbi:MAG TPA: hypothetical protein VGF67_10140 [Ktedonobacteraceae bacterium]